MNPVPLTLWGQGAVTLPKEWRQQFATKHFMAVVTSDGLLIKPIVEVEYYENSPTDFGLRFPMGMKPERFLELMDEGEKELKAEKRKNTRKPRRRTHG